MDIERELKTKRLMTIIIYEFVAWQTENFLVKDLSKSTQAMDGGDGNN